jgi:twitching motility protein PilT
MACANHIATGHTAQIYSVIETGGGNGMVTLDQSLEKLVKDGVITLGAALGLSRYPSQLKQRLGVI